MADIQPEVSAIYKGNYTKVPKISQSMLLTTNWSIGSHDPIPLKLILKWKFGRQRVIQNWSRSVGGDTERYRTWRFFFFSIFSKVVWTYLRRETFSLTTVTGLPSSEGLVDFNHFPGERVNQSIFRAKLSDFYVILSDFHGFYGVFTAFYGFFVLLKWF